MQKTLEDYGDLGVELLKQKVAPLSATNKTVNSIHKEVTENRLRILARAAFATIETGRPPRKSNEQSSFKDEMLAYMKARGIGQDLSEKKQKQLARFFTYKINKEGDKTYKSGGREVYSEALNKFVHELIKALSKDFAKDFIFSVKKSFNEPIGTK